MSIGNDSVNIGAMSDESQEPARAFLRHALATLAYRARKVLSGTPPEFGSFSVGERSRQPAAILAHMADLVDWALWLCKGERGGRNSEPSSWEAEIDRFYACLAALDEYLASHRVLAARAEAVFQGPIADALTHLGQIGYLRRLANAPVRGENYFVADIAVGRVGREQSPPRREFD